jgi:hypothetical protein
MILRKLLTTSSTKFLQHTTACRIKTTQDFRSPSTRGGTYIHSEETTTSATPIEDILHGRFDVQPCVRKTLEDFTKLVSGSANWYILLQ